MTAPFWSLPEAELLESLGSSHQGLGSEEAARRLARDGPNRIRGGDTSGALALLARQFATPLVLILFGAALLSLALHQRTEAAMVLAIVLASGLLGFWQEHGAAAAVRQLLAAVELRARVVRDGRDAEVPVRELVAGDIVLLAAGAGIPADCRLLEERDLFVDESMLTGESFPVDKSPGVLEADAAIARRTNALWLGTHVVSGSGRALVVVTGRGTEFGAIAARLRLAPEETEFERGVRRFGYLLAEVTLVLVFAIFAVNVYLHRPVVDSFLFALALAVGLTPQLLPAVISVNLARGASRMAERRVVVKRLAAIENFGSMDVLCADKTGTLTEGRVRVHAALDARGEPSARVLEHAVVNASFESSFPNPIDDALREHGTDAPPAGWAKVDEVPYDFTRKRLSILATREGHPWLVTKGSVDAVLEVCTQVEGADGRPEPLTSRLEAIRATYRALGRGGFRTLGVAVKGMPSGATITRDDERDLTFLGLVALDDPLKEGAAEAVAALSRAGITVKMITGDNAPVAARVGEAVGLGPAVLTGGELARLGDGALRVRAGQADIFAEIEPNQKERIIRALRRGGHVVGYMGDGINDAPALHAADVSISMQGAVDVAREAASIVLLDRDLHVLEQGVREGRRTFANTLKYVFMATSANFGNMFSMAGASLFLPFLPLLPHQILLTNLLTDLPELTIAGDRVDAEWIERPRRWDVAFIRRFMVTFGLVSSVFDYLTFGALLLLLRAGPAEFRSGWFVESVASAALIVLVVRTRRRPWRSGPARALLAATLSVVVAGVAIPFTPLGALFGFVPLPAVFLVVLAGILGIYMAAAEGVKGKFYRG
ncbi:MAG: magnesium-translocating P-type ATPase [Gemmatimonadaceae bacterium]